MHRAGETEPARPGQRYCKTHHNESMRLWRQTNRLEGEARRRANARSYLHVYVRRGHVQKTPCEHCGSLDVIAFIQDYNEPLNVRWLCRSFHQAEHRRINRLSAIEHLHKES